MEKVQKEKDFNTIQLIFICIPDERDLYNVIKNKSENSYTNRPRKGIMTQCIKDKLFMRTKPGYFNNFLRKTNAKLDGQNQALVRGQRPQVFTDRKTMVVGADVTHSGYHNPLSGERVASSIAAVVGSYDDDMTKFVASVSAQPPRVEIINGFDVHITKLLKEFFKRNNNTYPQIIVLFRDGVSEGQLQTVMDFEVELIKKAYKDMTIEFEPKIVVLVVQKRHHTRLFLSQPDVDRNNRENFNPRTGTVVDHTITNPYSGDKEFIIYSQKGLLVFIFLLINNLNVIQFVV